MQIIKLNEKTYQDVAWEKFEILRETEKAICLQHTRMSATDQRDIDDLGEECLTNIVKHWLPKSMVVIENGRIAGLEGIFSQKRIRPFSPEYIHLGTIAKNRSISEEERMSIIRQKALEALKDG